ncbi:MAG TPA: RtcB family protein [Armatimonadota bacterium]|nr:RtcB family protein [Armatimonadota bacterium]
MVTLTDVKQIEECVYEIPRSYRDDMRVPARVIADAAILEAASHDRGLEQLVNTACLPGITNFALAMPDIHQGYGPPIGGVLAMDEETGVISPGATGYDINCGVRLLASELSFGSVKPRIEALVDALFAGVPSGVGRGGALHFADRELDALLERGAQYVVELGYGLPDDLAHTEERGCLAGARADAVSHEAKKRGSGQCGTLGSGNHFIEIGRVAEIFDEATARVFGLFQGQLLVWIHSGSRGLGHQVCTDYVRGFQQPMREYGITVPDRELVCAPFASPEGQNYFAAMACAANYAWANRQVMAHLARTVFLDVLGADAHLRQVYDVTHNIVKRETYAVDGQPRTLIIHRKGATRCFPAGHADVPDAYRAAGHPVLVPGDMGTASYVLVGLPAALEKTFGSSCHGAGRVMSRAAASKQVQGKELQQRLRKQGVYVHGGSWEGLAEEAPEAYKDIDRVVRAMECAGVARRVAKAVPIGVIKG